MHNNFRSHSCQRGTATLAMALVLLAAATLAAAYGSLGLLVEQRQAGNQLRSAQAFAAAEAGLDWALAMLADADTIDTDCLASAAATTTFRDRTLRFDTASAFFVPRTALRRGSEAPLHMACIATDTNGWACHCPTDAAPWAPPFTADSTTARPAFAVRFADGPRAGTVQLIAQGCDHWSTTCLDAEASAAADPGHALARVQITLALMPALAAPPAAALTVRGSLAVGGRPAFADTDANAVGLAVHAGGTVSLPRAAAVGTPGAPSRDAVVAGDAALAGLDANAMFASTFGLDRTRWRHQPGLRTLHCDTPCDAALTALTRDGTASAIVRVDGDLHLDGPVTIGSAGHPVLLVVDGTPRLGAGVVVYGVIYTATAAWTINATNGANSALIHGALIAEGSLAGDGAPSVVRDAGVLERLHREIGLLTRIPGSWRDF